VWELDRKLLQGHAAPLMESYTAETATVIKALDMDALVPGGASECGACACACACVVGGGRGCSVACMTVRAVGREVSTIPLTQAHLPALLRRENDAIYSNSPSPSPSPTAEPNPDPTPNS
jgi:hypothetical protein